MQLLVLEQKRGYMELGLTIDELREISSALIAARKADDKYSKLSFKFSALFDFSKGGTIDSFTLDRLCRALGYKIAKEDNEAPKEDNE